jgi:hypothetical protein
MGRIVIASLLAAIAAAQPQPPTEGRKITGMSVVFSVDVPTDVPGAVLQPGTYVLRVKREPARAGDFAQLQLWDATETSVLADLYALQSYDTGARANDIMTYYEGTAGRRILKAWNLLTTHYSQQIVYPHAQAAELARLTSEAVLSMPLPSAPPVTAAAPVPPPSTSSAAREEATTAQTPPAEFPKTAGNLPLVLWFGFTCLAAFVVFRMYRIDPAVAGNARNNAVARRAAAAAYRTFKTAKAARTGAGKDA